MSAQAEPQPPAASKPAKIRIATSAFPPSYDVETNVEQHLALIEEARAAGCSLVVFPETSLQGYPAHISVIDTETRLRLAQAGAENIPDGPHVRRIIDAAAAAGIHVVFGLTEAGKQPGVMYNSLLLTGPDGFIGSYRKVHVGINEQIFWRQGTEWPVFDTPIGRIGLLICYDKLWPEACRELALGGAEILVMGTAWAAAFGTDDARQDRAIRDYEMFDRMRAVENCRWFISSNLAGNAGGFDFFGISQIVSPEGEVVARTEPFNTGLAIAEIDVVGGIAEAAATNQGSFLIRDRRPETYRILSGELPVAIQG